MEVLKWGKEVPNLSCEPGAKYGFVSEQLRQSFSAAKTCSMFCGGRKCKYCDAEPLGGASAWTDDQRVISGLYSNWITDNILAMSRPSEYVSNKHDLVDQFKKNHIRTIINLQRAGEHAACGPNALLPGGFSYDPEYFMKNDLFYYNFGWEDYNVGSLSNILDMVKVMQFSLSEGKVAVHCHAGLGRTGVLIACYLIYSNRVIANEAITYVRHMRPNSIQTRSQVQCVQDFATWIQPFRLIFPTSSSPANSSFTLTQYLTRQNQILHGYEARTLRYIPKKLLELANLGCDKFNSVKPKFTPSRLAIVTSDRPLTPQPKRMNSSTSTKHLVTVQSFTPVFSTHSSSEICYHSRSSSASSSSSNPTSSSGESNCLSRITDAVSFSYNTSATSDSIVSKVNAHKESLNERGDYRYLEEEEDAHVLCCLLWQWFERLKEPVLNAQDLPLMLEFVDEPLTGLIQLEKGSHVTILKLITFIQIVTHKNKADRNKLILRSVAALTQQSHGGRGDGDWLISNRLSDSLLTFFITLMTVL